ASRRVAGRTGCMAGGRGGGLGGGHGECTHAAGAADLAAGARPRVPAVDADAGRPGGGWREHRATAAALVLKSAAAESPVTGNNLLFVRQHLTRMAFRPAF